MDFGIAKMAQSTRLTATGQTMGTVRYMSPEQVRGQEVDLRTDMYSLGATMYESLVGETPFDGTTHFEIMTKHLSEPPKRPSTLGIEIPNLVEDAVMRCLAKRVDDRFDQARDLRKTLESALREGDVGLVETQRLNRQLLGDLRTKPAAQAGAPGVATASELADHLEPATAAVTTRRRRAKWPWIVAVLVVLGGGAAAALVVLREGGEEPVAAKKPTGELEVVASKGIARGDVDKGYREAVTELDAFVKQKLPRVTVRRSLEKIVVVPKPALCEPERYVEPFRVPGHCADDVAAVSSGAPRTLLVVDDPAGLRRAIDTGVSLAACSFADGFAVEGDERGEQADKLYAAVCTRINEFPARRSHR
jgi:hypothetical protein